MATLNVKVPDAMEADIEAYLAEHPHYLNKSDRVQPVGPAWNKPRGKPSETPSLERRDPPGAAARREASPANP